MSQHVPPRGLASSSEAYSNPDIDADAGAGAGAGAGIGAGASVGVGSGTPLTADTLTGPGQHWDSPSSHASQISSSPRLQTSFGDFPTSASTGRLINVPSLAGLGSLPYPGQRLNYPSLSNDRRSVSDSVTLKPVPGPPKAGRPVMAATIATTPTEVAKGGPRNSSMDTAISAISSKQGSPSQGGLQDASNASDITDLIKTAGTPEAVIQYLLKEKSSQSQQNSQLWRLVDKQRGMILGLNKDLEAALKDKEKYRRKLKEIMTSAAIIKAASGQQAETFGVDKYQGTISPRSPKPHPRVQTNGPPVSPSLDADSPKDFPFDMPMAPYPITPPADRPLTSPTAVSELLEPKPAMPKPQDHASDKFDHEVDDKVCDRIWKEKNEKHLGDISYNASLQPSRSCPSEPPKIPPPKIPTAAPSLTVTEPLPQPDHGLGQFPSPPRKPPPAPLQLKKQPVGRNLAAAAEDDSDSDYDHIFEVDEMVSETRGRRKTREEDDKERQAAASRNTQGRSTSKPSSESSVKCTVLPASPASRPTAQEHDKSTSINALLLAEKRIDIAAPLRSPGLPASPRPLGNISHSASAPVSARLAGAPAPLSSRAPRQAIIMPPTTPLISPPPLSSAGSSSTPPLNSAKRSDEASQHSPTARAMIHKGLVTEEYPNLLLPPNALPSIKIQVASSRMKPSRASLISLTQLEEDPVFTLAVISRAHSSELWRVEKDIASLSKLDSRLKQCSAYTAKTPDRALFTGHAPAKLDARRVALEEYMVELLDTPFDTATAVELCKYLSTNTLPPNADETGSSFRPSPEGSGLNIGADGRPLRSGYLTKKGKNFGGWKARFFVLEGPEPEFKYYETPGGAHLGTIRLRNAHIGKQSHTQTNENQSSSAQPSTGEDLDNEFRHAFLIMEPKKRDSSAHVKHILCAESDKERDIWVDVLLQWIDYQDADEDRQPLPPSAKSPHDQQPSGHEQTSSARSKKSPSSRTQHKHANSDTLIGVRYDSTHAGEAPQKGSTALAEQHSPHNLAGETMTSQANKLISAPKDPQIISDSSVWGNRAGLAAPTHDEKKQRKRSFFGFGPKTRTSSDGQDSLFGGSDASSASNAPPSHGHQGPVRQVFGAPLAEAVRYNPPVDVNVPLPSVVYRCIRYLDHHNAISEEGIFRLSGSNLVIKQLRERFNAESDVNLVADEQYHDIHAVASLLKLYLRELPTAILTRDLHLPFLHTTEIADRNEKIAKMKELGQRLPRANATLLKYLIAFLIRIINNSDVNKMTVRNVGIVFSPTLNIPAQVFAMFLQNYEAIFGIDPEEYQLPRPSTEAESQGQAGAPPQRLEPTRPSTSSGGSASPHTQPRMDRRREPSRSTPTPPLMSHVQTARSTPTPPLTVHGGGASRPAYESGYGLPNGVDGHGHHPPPRTAAGYERPMYAASSDEHGSSDAKKSAKERRRESLVYMGAVSSLHHQGSKSRLREETRLF
ncbi:RhoGAP domain protein [Metarhizium album ARSEF 1941]|uniref:RhoGAP domain protein n=1 Tax=Metarhizium album (strain ARSEF 1941) TaxID=1081103 RepID=A0A0B2WPE2_METAS|nr:RhoGAP domain protein [Metarhizium album ARSEF 1941]KHN95337.1 RhoGAP domain protein [Metarhizium album ARSEF 1941]